MDKKENPDLITCHNLKEIKEFLTPDFEVSDFIRNADLNNPKRLFLAKVVNYLPELYCALESSIRVEINNERGWKDKTHSKHFFELMELKAQIILKIKNHDK